MASSSRFWCRINNMAACSLRSLSGGGGSRWFCGRSAVSDESAVPWMMLPPTIEDDKKHVYNNFYSVIENKVLTVPSIAIEEFMPHDAYTLCVGSSHGWLAFCNRRTYDLYLFNPISSRHIKLPRLDTLHEQKKFLLVQRPVKKLIVSSCSPDADDCRALIIFGCNENLAFCSPAHSESWMLIDEIGGAHSDIVYSSRQQLYFASKESDRFQHYFPKQGNEIEAWDLGNLSSPKKIPMQIQMEEKKDDYRLVGLEQCFLVPYSNELFLVRRFVCKCIDPSDGSYHSKYHPDNKGWENTLHKTLGFNVYKYDTESKFLVYLDRSIGDDVAFFIGSNHSFGISTKQLPELKPNSIYFTDVIPQLGIPRNEIIGGHDNGIFNYADKTFSPCYYPCDLKSFRRIKPAPMWFSPSHPIS